MCQSANRKSANFYDKFANRKSANFLNTAQLCLKSVPKVVFVNVFLYDSDLNAIFVRRKVWFCGLAEVLSPQITKRLDWQIANPHKSHICDLRSLFADRQPFYNFINVTAPGGSIAQDGEKTVSTNACIFQVRFFAN